jgi:hypothetical protein
MTDIQTEKSFQKQDGININNKYLLFGDELPSKSLITKLKNAQKKKKNESNKIF